MQILESPQGSNSKPQESTAYPRRDPRVGSQYQTKILQNCTKNDGRRPPDRISHEHVYSYCCYDPKTESNEDDSTDTPAAATTTSMMATGPILASYDLETSLQTEKIPRGGLKVHSPSTEAHRFAQVVEPIVLSLGSSSSWSNPTTKNSKNGSHETSKNNYSPTKGYTFKGGNQTPEGFMASSQNEDWRKDVFWQKYMLELQGRVAERSKRRPQRGTRKRRRGSNTSEDSTVSNRGSDDMPLCLEQMVEDQQMFVPQFGEDNAHSIAFLHHYHNGNAKAATMKLFTNLMAGKASKRRKLVKLKRLQQKKLPPVQSSESWRRVYEQTQLMSIIDHLEEKASLPYSSKHSCVPQSKSRSRAGSNGDIMMLDAADTSKDDLKEAWTTILSIGRSVKDQLDGWESGNSKTKAEKKIACSALLAFIRNAYRLEPPEVCFGSHHVMIEEVSHCLLDILEHVEAARNAQAEIRDKLYQESIATGSDSDVLQKYVQGLCKVLPIRLDEENLLAEFREIVTEWEGRLGSSAESSNSNKDEEWGELEVAQQLALEAKSHGYVSKEVIDLQARIEKALVLKQRVLAWKETCDEGNGGTMRTVSALAKELKKLKLDFQEKREFLEFYNVLQNWLDRTNIAIRSRMSLVEVRTLLTQGADFPLDLGEYVGKLKSRVSSAEAWLERLEDVVPCPKNASGEHDVLEWSKGMRSALYEGRQGLLQDIVSDGSRIPVEVEALKVLQVEIDAKNWTSKAQKWLPVNEENKKGKVTDLKDHIERAHSLRERLTFLEDQKKAWELAGEAELTAIVDAADSWLQQYKPFVDGDNRRNKSRKCLSLSTLRQIVAEEKKIFANIGLPAIKMARILTQAESWYEKHQPLLRRCNLEEPNPNASKPIVDPTEMKNAVQAATSSISLDLEEAVALKKLADRIQHWFGQVGTVVKPKNKKHNQKFTTEEILELINESSTLPINVENEVSELRSHLQAVEEWKSHATKDLEEIGGSFLKIQEKMTAAYGPPNKFSIDLLVKNSDWGAEGNGTASKKMETKEETKVESTTENAETSSGHGDLLDVIALHDCPEERTTIQKLQAEARDIGVATVEADLLDLFDGIAKWWLRSLKYLNSPREVFDKRYFGAFDRFADDGEKLVSRCATFEKQSNKSTDDSCESPWSKFVAAQLDRMKILRSERSKFVSWCDQAKEILADEKKLTLEKLKSLVKNSQKFPPVNDMVQQVRILAEEVSRWAEHARPIIHSGKKLDMPTVKVLLESGEKLKVNTEELRILRAAMKAVRKWTNRVKKCDLDQGDTKISTVNDLIEEHESLLIEMPDDLARLHQATQAYCICRRPYEGFMIGCDECSEWYHGPCIGVSQARADRFDKFVCVRCSMKNLFKNSAVGAVEITKKWTSRKCLKKARQVEHQKHQRKVRKETKDMEKLKAKLVQLEAEKLPEQKLPEEPKADNTEGERKAIADLVAAKPADKPLESVVEQPVATFADQTREATDTSESVADKSSGTLAVGAIDKPDETQDESVADKAPQAQASEATDTKAEPVVDGSAKPPAEDPNVPSSDNAAEKATGKSAETKTTESQRPQDEVQNEIDKINVTMGEIEDRLVELQKKLKEQKQMEAIENKNAENLRKWCIRVRSFVLLPSTDELRENARPPLDGGISKIMESVLSEAEAFGIASLNDVGSMRNLFKCMSWSLLGLSIINRKPTLEEMNKLISKASDLRLPDEKALKTMKLMAHRSEQVRCKIQKVLAVRPGESKPVKQSVLNELVASAESVALIIQESTRVYATIENKGIPPDSNNEELNCAVRVRHGCISPHGHDPKKLWPPFALFGSPEVIELLGPECSLIPEDTSAIAPEESSVAGAQPNNCKSQAESQLQTMPRAPEVSSTSVAEQVSSSAAIQNQDENKTDTEAVSMETESSIVTSASSSSMKETSLAEAPVSQCSEKEKSTVASSADERPLLTPSDCNAAPLADPNAMAPKENGREREQETPPQVTPEIAESQAAVTGEASPVLETGTPIGPTSEAEASAAETTSGVMPSIEESTEAATPTSQTEDIERKEATSKATASTEATVSSTSQIEDIEMTDVQPLGGGETTPAAVEVPAVTSSEISSVATGGASVASTNESPRGGSTKEAVGENAQEPPVSSSNTTLPAPIGDASGGDMTVDSVGENPSITAMKEVPVDSSDDAAVVSAKEEFSNTSQEVPISSNEMDIDGEEETQHIQLPVSMETENAMSED